MKDVRASRIAAGFFMVALPGILLAGGARSGAWSLPGAGHFSSCSRPVTSSPEIHRADRILLATEKRDLMAHDSWAWPILEGVEPLSEPIVPWSPEVSMERFLHRFIELAGGSHGA